MRFCQENKVFQFHVAGHPTIDQNNRNLLLTHKALKEKIVYHTLSSDTEIFGLLNFKVLLNYGVILQEEWRCVGHDYELFKDLKLFSL